MRDSKRFIAKMVLFGLLSGVAVSPLIIALAYVEGRTIAGSFTMAILVIFGATFMFAWLSIMTVIADKVERRIR